MQAGESRTDWALRELASSCGTDSPERRMGEVKGMTNSWCSAPSATSLEEAEIIRHLGESCIDARRDGQLVREPASGMVARHIRRCLGSHVCRARSRKVSNMTPISVSDAPGAQTKSVPDSELQEHQCPFCGARIHEDWLLTHLSARHQGWPESLFRMFWGEPGKEEIAIVPVAPRTAPANPFHGKLHRLAIVAPRH